MMIYKSGSKYRVIVVSWFNVVMLVVVVTLAMLVVYSTHQSRLLSARISQFNDEIKEQKIRRDQLMLEEGTFARTVSVERKAIEELQLQHILLEQVVRVTP